MNSTHHDNVPKFFTMQHILNNVDNPLHHNNHFLSFFFVCCTKNKNFIVVIINIFIDILHKIITSKLGLCSK